MHPAVELAIGQIKSTFPSSNVEIADDGSGGAYVRVHDLPFGDQHEPNAGWVAFHVTHVYPHSDVYGHYLPPGLARTDKGPLGEGFHASHPMKLGSWEGTCTFVSRRSNKWNPSHDTAALKLQKVLEWMRTR